MTETPAKLRPSELDGGPPTPTTSATLTDALTRAATAGQGDIVFLDEQGVEERQSYADLRADAARILGGLRMVGKLVPGAKIVIQIDRDPDLLALFWACVLGGYVPVPVSTNPPPNSPFTAAELLAGVWGMLDDAWVVTSAAIPADSVFADRWLGEVGVLRGDTLDTDFHRADPDDLAALLLTSGSTGLPKAVMLTHRNILSRSCASAEVRHLSPADRSFNWMPLDHVGGLIMFHARDVVVGCHQVHARIGWVLADPLRWPAAISRYRCTNTWAPNFAFGLIIDRADEIASQSWDLTSLRYIMNGGESIKARVARRFLTILAPFGLPATAMHPGWGMSETSAGVVDTVFSMVDTDDDDRFVPVGVPHPGVALRVVDVNGELVPEGTVGRLQASGLPITSGYYGDDGQNRQSFTDDGWFKTGDLAFIAAGELTVTGRVDDVIAINGADYYGHEIEAAVEELPFVTPSYTVACEIPADDSLAIFYCPRSGMTSDEHNWRIVEHVADRFGLTARYVVPVTTDEVPKTGIGKLKRAQLAKRLSTT
jgi:acyl-CoA synthetase (AMP-forming)/AMP-acid ligase II